MNVVVFGQDIVDRMVEAVENVRKRLQRSTTALNAANIPYAVIGGNAVAAWVSKVDPGAVMYTQYVDILLRRSDLPLAIKALEKAGFVYRHAASIDMFLDGPQGRARDAVHAIFAGEKVRPEYSFPAPDVDESFLGNEGYRYLDLESLVRMKLTSNRRKDQVHVLSFIELGLVDASWLAKLPTPLDERLQALLDTPEG